MQVQVNKLSPVLIEFDVEVAADRVSSEIEKAFTAVAKNARIRGFRPGKAPRGVLKSMFGARIAADVAQRLVDETFPQAVSAASPRCRARYGFTTSNRQTGLPRCATGR